jgi:hypothetical protein
MKDAHGNEIVDPATTPPATVPPENKEAELRRKLEESERREQVARQEADMLREQRLREMARPPAQAPEPENEDELNNEFATSPVKAVRKIISREAADIDKRIEQRARQIYVQEAKKIEAITKFPELKNPTSDFFKKVAYYMDTHPEKYNDPEGLMDACARVSIDMGIAPQKPAVAAANARTIESVSSAASQVAGGGTAPVGGVPELDAKGLELASKLGIDPKVMAKRMEDYNNQKGEYAPAAGKTGKGTFKS